MIIWPDHEAKGIALASLLSISFDVLGEKNESINR
jgi:hypothetical protein